MPSSSSIFQLEDPGDVWVPAGYQDEGVRFLLQNPHAGLFFDPGLGKTSVTYQAIAALRRRGTVPTVLVVTPLRPAYQVWPAERDKWRQFRELRYELLHGPDKGARADRSADLYVINPEGLRWLLTEKRPAWLDGAMLVVDESTKFKNSQAKRFKLLRKHLHRFTRRVILTGSPRPRHLEDLFGQVYLLDRGKALGEYVTHFRHRFCLPGFSHDHEWVPKPGAEEEVYRRIAPMVLRKDVDELDMPPLVDVPPIEVRLPPDARRLYREMEEEFVAELESGEVVAANAAAKTTKLRQLANGGVYTDKRGNFQHVHDAKTEAVSDLVEQLQGKPALVAYDTAHDLDRLKRALGRDTPHLGGGVSGKRGGQLEEAWNAGDLEVLLVQPVSVAHGLNLQAEGHALVWHSLTYDYEVYDQLIRRLWRQGRRGKVLRYHLLAERTVDLAIYRSLHVKEGGQNDFFQALKEHYLDQEKNLSKGFTSPGGQPRVGINGSTNPPTKAPTREDVPMSEFQEGQRVRLLPDETEGIPEEFGYIEEQADQEDVVVRLDEEYRDADDPNDDGIREVPADQLEVVEEGEEGEAAEAAEEGEEGEEAEEGEAAEAAEAAEEAGDDTAYILNVGKMSMVGRFQDVQTAEEVAEHYQETNGKRTSYLVIPAEDREAGAKALGELDVNGLTKLYNGLVGTKQAVKKLKTKKDGIKKVLDQLDELDMAIMEKPPIQKPAPKAEAKKGGGSGKKEQAKGEEKPKPKRSPKVEPGDLIDALPKSFPQPQEGEKSGGYILRLMKLGEYSDEVLCAASLKHFGGKTNVKNVGWIRSNAKRKEGAEMPGRIPFGNGKGEAQLAKRAGVEL
ncbi:MAG TPA: DEAD/DEAH box helicase [Gammaproteobacteria bacterium]|nr:DEAD/DEAH box helicase [Gammaproteobacteria bacterium]